MEPRDESEGVDPDQTLADANGVPVLRHLVHTHIKKMSLIVRIDTIDKNIWCKSRKGDIFTSQFSFLNQGNLNLFVVK